jgi:hypothetical protein
MCHARIHEFFPRPDCNVCRRSGRYRRQDSVSVVRPEVAQRPC